MDGSGDAARHRLSLEQGYPVLADDVRHQVDASV